MSGGLASLLGRLQPAGVILFARNVQSAQQTWRFLRECQKCVATPLLPAWIWRAERLIDFAMRWARRHRQLKYLLRASVGCFVNMGGSLARTAGRLDLTWTSRRCSIWHSRRRGE